MVYSSTEYVMLDTPTHAGRALAGWRYSGWLALHDHSRDPVLMAPISPSHLGLTDQLARSHHNASEAGHRLLQSLVRTSLQTAGKGAAGYCCCPTLLPLGLSCLGLKASHSARHDGLQTRNVQHGLNMGMLFLFGAHRQLPCHCR